MRNTSLAIAAMTIFVFPRQPLILEYRAMRRILWLILFFTAGRAWGDEPLKQSVLISKPDAFKTLVNPTCSHCIACATAWTPNY